MHLTLKLRNQNEDRTFIIGCKSVNVIPTVSKSGYHVQAVDSEGAKMDFNVGPGYDFDIAYVESFNGSTSHIVRKYL